MAAERIIGLRYCGGCNPWYDRVAAVERLRALHPELRFVPARPGRRYPAVLVVCGCPARCADVSGLEGTLVWLCGSEQLEEAAQALKQANM